MIHRRPCQDEDRKGKSKRRYKIDQSLSCLLRSNRETSVWRWRCEAHAFIGSPIVLHDVARSDQRWIVVDANGLRTVSARNKSANQRKTLTKQVS
jgi:hypothetical protein